MRVLLLAALAGSAALLLLPAASATGACAARTVPVAFDLYACALQFDDYGRFSQNTPVDVRAYPVGPAGVGAAQVVVFQQLHEGSSSEFRWTSASAQLYNAQLGWNEVFLYQWHSQGQSGAYTWDSQSSGARVMLANQRVSVDQGGFNGACTFYLHAAGPLPSQPCGPVPLLPDVPDFPVPPL